MLSLAPPRRHRGHRPSAPFRTDTKARRSTVLQHRGPRPAAERGGPRAAVPPPVPSWPQALRAVRAWLSPWIVLQRWWAAWSKAPPPPQLQALINSVAAGCGLHLYILT